jgi:hypothetical protein
MRIIRDKISKNKSPVYVVTRDKRRIQEQDYNNKLQAIERAEILVEALKKFDPEDARKVEVYITSYPRNFR